MSMTLLSFLFTLCELAMKYGIPAAIKIINGWQDAGNPITAESFEELRNNHKAPEDFLNTCAADCFGNRKKMIFRAGIVAFLLIALIAAAGCATVGTHPVPSDLEYWPGRATLGDYRIDLKIHSVDTVPNGYTIYSKGYVGSDYIVVETWMRPDAARLGDEVLEMLGLAMQNGWPISPNVGVMADTASSIEGDRVERLPGYRFEFGRR